MLEDLRRSLAWQTLRAARVESELEEARRELSRVREQLVEDARQAVALREQAARLGEDLAETRARLARTQDERRAYFRETVTARVRLRELRPGDSRLSFGRDAAPVVRLVPVAGALVPVASVESWPPVPIEGEDEDDTQGRG